MTELNAFIEPGMLVRNTAVPDWGVGQVQSNIGGKLTVNFPNAGKVVLDATVVTLEIVYGED